MSFKSIASVNNDVKSQMQKAQTQSVDNQNSENKIKEMDESGSPGILNPSSTIAAYEDFLNKFKDIDLSYG